MRGEGKREEGRYWGEGEETASGVCMCASKENSTTPRSWVLRVWLHLYWSIAHHAAGDVSKGSEGGCSAREARSISIQRHFTATFCCLVLVRLVAGARQCACGRWLCHTCLAASCRECGRMERTGWDFATEGTRTAQQGKSWHSEPYRLLVNGKTLRFRPGTCLMHKPFSLSLFFHAPSPWLGVAVMASFPSGVHPSQAHPDPKTPAAVVPNSAFISSIDPNASSIAFANCFDL